MAHQIIDAKPKTVKRRGSIADMTAVLRFVVIKAQGGRLKFTEERAVRHLGWAGWDVEETAPTVQTARGKLERSLAWIMDGTHKQQSLKLPPLLRRVQKVYRSSGHSAPSEYKVLWEDWGGAFVRRVSGSREVGSDTSLGRAGAVAN